MPALVDGSHPTFSRHYYGPPAVSSEQLTTPKSVPTWQDLGAASEIYNLPARYHGLYDSRSNDEYSCSFEGSVVGRESGSPWTDAGLYEPSPPTFLPTPTDTYHRYTGSPGFADVNSRWNAADYRSHFGDYPTPQSNLSLSPPQQSLGKALPHGHPGGQYIAASNAVASQHTLGDLLKLETSASQQLRFSAAGEDDSAHQHDDETRHKLDECDDSDDEDGGVHCEPYAQLIFRALKSAPGHRMVLKDIYRWFEKNTDKARKSSRGWQNSIRHNLSMNGGFKKVDQDPPNDEAKRGFIWVLEPSALVEGVKSTTRYRKPGSNKKSAKARQPAPERQRSGAKGGKAARKAAKMRRSARFARPDLRMREDVPLPSIEVAASSNAGQPLTPSSLWMPENEDYLFSTASRSLSPMRSERTMYDYADIGGVTSLLPNGPLFAGDGADLDVGGSLSFHSFNDDGLMMTGSNHGLPDH
ncbi:MAG: hypothetical protein Q9208_008546 [Pyrenodesmia sp. 3 TL-2023]